MLDFIDIMNDLDGNGLTETEVLAISNDLAQFTKMRDRVMAPLSDLYSAEQLKEILLVVEPPSLQRQVMANIFGSLSKREKECFLLYTVENVPMSAIGVRLGVSKGSVNAYIRRAREKMKLKT
jgi:RNA polymerase sigma factor (sigma-70 family)